jgi:catechol 2,3-dioxygenase-like lactoylglutathione lyase family enzyme
MTPVIDHVQVTVRDLERAIPFYDLLLGLLGFHVEARVRATVAAHDFEVVEYPHPTLAFAISSPRQAFQSEATHRRKPGALHHLAFKAGSRDEVDRLAHALEEGGATMAGGPCLWPQHGADYYAVFVKDPDGLKYEIVHNPHPHV